jgi:16S rRNA G966 N2-methylase RsmD
VRALRADLRRLPADAYREQAVIFVDPPYELAPALWAQRAGTWRSWISTDGVLVFETDRKTTLELQPGWLLAETREYGVARFHLWIPA